jgi:hypothetical protein
LVIFSKALEKTPSPLCTLVFYHMPGQNLGGIDILFYQMQ